MSEWNSSGLDGVAGHGAKIVEPLGGDNRSRATPDIKAQGGQAVVVELPGFNGDLA